MKLLYLFCLLLSGGAAHAQTGTSFLEGDTTNNTLLWEISGNGLAAPAYLFGTFHLLCKNDIHFSEAVKQAISNSNEVYLELDLDDPATIFGAVTLMNMKNGKTLKDLYSPAEYARVSVFFKDSLKMPVSMLQTMKPEFLVALLYPKMMPCEATGSVEEFVMKFAKKAGKQIKGLETMAFQASVFDSIPYEKQAAELLNMIDSPETAGKQFDLMAAAYKAQDLTEIEKIMNSPEYGMGGHQDILLDNRNKNWVQQLKEIMSKKSVFAAVGAGHLPGKNGLISLLKADGFTLRALKN